MTRIFIVLAIATACLSPVWASNPGEPLDCSDWVFLEPGFSCSQRLPMDCSDNPFCYQGANMVADNEGNLLLVRRRESVPGLGICSVQGNARDRGRIEISVLEGGIERVVAFCDDRCHVGDGVDTLLVRSGACNPNNLCAEILRMASPVHFDDSNGSLIFPVVSRCEGGVCNYGGMWLAAIRGFTTTFEILQTYTPPSGPISFRVPYMPEGFQHADWFDTYYGDLATVGDWSQLQPLQCGYPASPPSVGDYLTVTDPLPPPSPGQGRYYVTAVTYAGQTRYGRKATGGVLSGRDPAVLPACSP